MYPGSQLGHDMAEFALNGLAPESALYSTLDVLMIRSYPFVCLGGSTPPPGPPRWYRGKESTCQCRRHKRHEFDPWVKKIPWRREHGNPLPYSCLENLMDRGAWFGYSPWGHKEWDTTECARIHTHTHTHTHTHSSSLFPHSLFLADSFKFTKCLLCARTGPCSSEAAVMNGTWSLPYNIHCLTRKETGG